VVLGPGLDRLLAIGLPGHGLGQAHDQLR
jgi:hypothetical protein